MKQNMGNIKTYC